MHGPSLQAAHGPTAPDPWYERDGGARLAQDRTVVAARYPSLNFRIDEEREQGSLEGELILRSESGVPVCIAVRVEFPSDYPVAEPLVFDADDQFPHTRERHFLECEACCLWLPPLSRWDSQDPLGLGAFLDE